MRTTLAATLGAISLLAVTANSGAQVRAEYDRGAGALSRLLQRLQTTASVLHTGAHPDDEDSALIAYHARKDHARTAYLSLTRGSGGQNIIGPEQADLLGVIRTEELLQARRLDGASQFFTRAVDFGFSKHLGEGRRVWNEQLLLEDMVRTIRRFRPTVMVSRWDGTPADGHGHHQFSGYLTPLAYAAAADPAQFPQHIAEGLLPWQVSRLFVAARPGAGEPGASHVTVNTGAVDPVAGRSYFQIGMRGRSQQKTQQMGALELNGEQTSTLRLTESIVESAPGGVFDGLDLGLSSIANFEPQASADLVLKLRELERLAATALAEYRPLSPGQLAAPLAQGLAVARTARSLARSPDAKRLLDEKILEFEEALLLSSGIIVDAIADRETIVPGEVINVAVRAFLPDGSDAQFLQASVSAPTGWSVASRDSGLLPNERQQRRREQADAGAVFRLTAPANAEATEPYWLTRPRQGFMYDWSDAGAAQTDPFSRSLLTATAEILVAGQSLQVKRDVRHRTVDRVRGELRQRIDVVPAITVSPATSLEIIAAAADKRSYDVILNVSNNSTQSASGVAALEVPRGWSVVPENRSFSLAPNPSGTALSFRVALPEELEPGRYAVLGKARVNGVDYQQSMQTISYPHIDTHRVYADASMDFNVIDVMVAPVSVGYIMGSGDVVPDALRRLGLQVSLLDDETLASGDLSRYDTIVVGIRASQTRAGYVAANQRLLDFVDAGGTMVVQYQQPDFVASELAPYPVSMERNVRVVDETAPVVILEPEHPVFNFPNRIGPADFDNWVQERNNYNFTDFDRSRYVALTESHDPGEPDSDGAMLYAMIGRGHYVYTAYSWFRQLPNGTPGGYRIFANLLSLPAAPE